MRVRDIVLSVDKFGSVEFDNGGQSMFVRKLESRQRYHVVIEGNIYELSEAGFVQFFKNIKNR